MNSDTMYGTKQMSINEPNPAPAVPATRSDRRVLRTRAALQAAVLSLVAEHSLDSLTIGQITDRADLRRATFYMHFRDKEELLMSALEANFAALEHAALGTDVADGFGGKTQPAAYLVTFEHAAANAALYRNLLTGRSAGLFFGHIRGYLAAFILRYLRSRPSQGGIPPEVLANYLAGAELALIAWWLDQGQAYTAPEMAAYMHRLAVGGLAGLSDSARHSAGEDQDQRGEDIQPDRQGDEEAKPEESRVRRRQ